MHGIGGILFCTWQNNICTWQNNVCTWLHACYNSEAANSLFGNIDVAIHVSGSIDRTISTVNSTQIPHGIWGINNWYPVRLVRSRWIFLDCDSFEDCWLIRQFKHVPSKFFVLIAAENFHVTRPICCEPSNDLTSGSSQLSVFSSEYLVNASLYRLCRAQVWTPPTQRIRRAGMGHVIDPGKCVFEGRAQSWGEIKSLHTKWKFILLPGLLGSCIGVLSESPIPVIAGFGRSRLYNYRESIRSIVLLWVVPLLLVNDASVKHITVGTQWRRVRTGTRTKYVFKEIDARIALDRTIQLLCHLTLCYTLTCELIVMTNFVCIFSHMVV